MTATATNDRLAELVQDLTGCADDDANWALGQARRAAAPDEDALATVARAMVLLRRHG